MRNLWIALGLAVIMITAGAALAGEPAIAARPGFPVDQSGRIYMFDGNASVGISIYSTIRTFLAKELTVRDDRRQSHRPGRDARVSARSGGQHLREPGRFDRSLPGTS